MFINKNEKKKKWNGRQSEIKSNRLQISFLMLTKFQRIN